MYRLDDESKSEILSYHWHPLHGDVEYPHLHLKGLHRRSLQKGHIPTGRIAIESFVEYLIRDHDVEPLRGDWYSVLKSNRESFQDSRSWS